MKDVFIVEAVRTAIGNFGGAFTATGAVDLGAAVVKALLERTKVGAAEVDEIVLGCVLQAGLGQNPARQVLVKAGLPVERTAMKIGRAHV